jgi:hypothetical protein
MLKNTIAGLGLALFAAAAVAQEIPKPKCEPKPEYPGRLASDRTIKAYNTSMKAYDECMRKYIEEQREKSKQYLDAANAAIEEFNNTMREQQAARDATK